MNSPRAQKCHEPYKHAQKHLLFLKRYWCTYFPIDDGVRWCMLYYGRGTRNLVATSLIYSEQLPLTYNWCSSCTYSQIWQAKAVCAYKKVSWLSYIWSVFSDTGETSPSQKQKLSLDSETRIPTLY